MGGLNLLMLHCRFANAAQVLLHRSNQQKLENMENEPMLPHLWNIMVFFFNCLISAAKLMRFQIAGNLLGLPAISIPVILSSPMQPAEVIFDPK